VHAFPVSRGLYSHKNVNMKGGSISETTKLLQDSGADMLSAMGGVIMVHYRAHSLLHVPLFSHTHACSTLWTVNGPVLPAIPVCKGHASGQLRAVKDRGRPANLL
jgi:hypothetical protein